jgi:AraC family transcriptional regulator
MRLHLDREVSLEELAEIANFSKFHFHRIFKAVTGIPPSEYGVQLRVVGHNLVYSPIRQSLLPNWRFVWVIQVCLLFPKALKEFTNKALRNGETIR